jgi:hypothetical protein
LQSAQSAVKKLEEQIYQMVYNLYGLTSKHSADLGGAIGEDGPEIAIIEGN